MNGYSEGICKNPSPVCHEEQDWTGCSVLDAGEGCLRLQLKLKNVSKTKEEAEMETRLDRLTE